MADPAPSGQCVELLLVEDNRGDVRLIEEAFADAQILNEIHTATDGREALDFLYQRGEFEDAPRPDLILLDWHLPRVGGEEVLETVKDDESLSRIPVVVLTGSETQRSVLESYDLQANAYLEKPVRPGEFIETVRSVGEFWLSIVRLPPTE